jgi:hypothetical protein
VRRGASWTAAYHLQLTVAAAVARPVLAAWCPSESLLLSDPRLLLAQTASARRSVQRASSGRASSPRPALPGSRRGVGHRCPAGGVHASGSSSGIRLSSRAVSARPVSARAVSARPVSGYPGLSSGVRRSGRLLSTRPVSTPSAVHPSVRVASVSPIAGGGVETRSRRPGNPHHRNGSRSLWRPPRRANGSTDQQAWGRRRRRARAVVSGGRWRTRAPGWCGRRRSRVPAARPGRPRRRAEPPVAGGLRRGQGSRPRRELAAAAAWLPSSGWVGDHGEWWPWRRPVRVATRSGAGGGMRVRPQRGPGWQRALPARCRQRCDLGGWLVGLPGLEPGLASTVVVYGRAELA